jgi:tetratricopeptide (TPR) repeat protein
MNTTNTKQKQSLRVALAIIFTSLYPLVLVSYATVYTGTDDGQGWATQDIPGATQSNNTSNNSRGSGGGGPWGLGNLFEQTPSGPSYQDIKDKQEQQAWRANERGRDAMKRKDFASALQAFQEAVQWDPSNRVYQANVAIAHANLAILKNDNNSALSFYQEAARLNPRKDYNASIANTQGAMALGKGDLNTALRCFQEAVKYNHSPIFRENLAVTEGIIAMKRGDWNSALKYCQEALKFAKSCKPPNLTDIAIVQSFIAHAQGGIAAEKKDWNTALRYSQEALRLNPTNHVLQANVLFDQAHVTGDWSSALRFTQQEVKSNPTTNAKANLAGVQGHVAEAKGEWKSSINYYREALKLEPTDKVRQESLARAEARAAGSSTTVTSSNSSQKSSLPLEPFPQGNKQISISTGEETQKSRVAGTNTHAGEQLGSTTFHSNKAANSESLDRASEEARRGFDGSGEHAGKIDSSQVVAPTSSIRHPEISTVPNNLRNNEKIMGYHAEASKWAAQVDKLNHDLETLEQDTSNKNNGERNVEIAKKRSEKSIAQSNVDAAELNKQEAIHLTETEIKK